MADNDIRVKSSFQDNTTAGVNKMNQSMQRGFKQTEQSSKTLTAGFKTLAKAAGGLFVFAKVVGFLKNSVAAYDKQAKAEVQLATALGRTSQALLNQASALQKVTLFGDEQTIQAQALIAAFVKEEEQIKKITPLVQDLATAKGMDLAGAADLVSKTLGSSTNALARYGIKVEGAVGSTARLESLQRGLESAFGGSAEAAAKAGSGPLKQFSNIIGDISEDIGELLIPLLVDMTGTAGETAEAFSGLVGVFAGVIGGVKSVVGVFFIALEIITASVQGLIGLVGLIPARFLPKGWADSIDNAVRDIDELRKTFKIAGDDVLVEAMESFGLAGKYFSGIPKAAEGAIPAKSRPPKGDGDGDGDGEGVGDGDGETKEKARLSAIADVRNEFLKLETMTKQEELADLETWYMERAKIIGDNEKSQLELHEVFKAREAEIEEEYKEVALFSEEQIAAARANVRNEFRQLEMDEKQTELDDLETWYMERSEIVGDNQESQLELHEIFKSREADIDAKYDEKKKAQDKKAFDDYKKIQLKGASVTADVFGSMSDLLKVAGKEQKEYAGAAKALAIVETTINTYVGAQKAFNSLADIPYVGFALGIAAAAAAVVAGLARVASIAGQNFEQGGIVQGSQFRGDNVQANLNSREGVFTVEQQQTLFDIASGRIQPIRGAGIENLSVNVYGNMDEETTEDMIEKIDDLLEERRYSGIAA